MIDTRFYNVKHTMTIASICEKLACELPKKINSKKTIRGIENLDEATVEDVTFFHNSKYSENLKETKACACLIKKEHAHLLPKNVAPIIVEEPYYALALILMSFYEPKGLKISLNSDETYISPKANVSESATIGKGCYISDFVTIGANAIIKDHTIIGTSSTIREGVEIGENSRIEPNVTIGFSIIGAKAYIKSGARIGQPGFGFYVGKAGPVDVLQIGRVIIGRDVQIGANCTIDRGSMGDTVIGHMVRIDDMVHIAHNVHIGDYCVIAAQTGIAGSTTLGKGCVLGGQVGIAGHIKIGDKVTIAAQSGVANNIESGRIIGGTPATSLASWNMQNVLLRKMVSNRNK